MGQTFNVGDATFKLAAVDGKAMRLEVAAVPSPAASARSRIRKGHALNLENTATGVLYTLLFTRGHRGCDRQGPARRRRRTTTTAASGTRAGQLNGMNSHQRKATRVEMSNKIDTPHAPAAAAVAGPRVRVGARDLRSRLRRAGSAASGPQLSPPVGLSSFVQRLDEPRRSQRPACPSTRGRRRSRGRRCAAPRATSSSSPRAISSAPTTGSSGRAGRERPRRPRSRSRCRGSPAIPRRCTGASAPSAAVRFGVERTSAVHDALAERSDAELAGRPPGYVRWHPVDGATGYQVWFVNAEQDHHDDHERRRRARVLRVPRPPVGPVPSSGACARCAASTASRSNGLPAVSYGPWSATVHIHDQIPASTVGRRMTPLAAVSDRVSTTDTLSSTA